MTSNIRYNNMSLNAIVERIFIHQNKGKSKGKSKSKGKESKWTKPLLSKLVLNVLLVYYGVRDAYLVDCCLVEELEAIKLLSDICTVLKLDLTVLGVVSMHMDCIIVNLERLKCKMDGLMNLNDSNTSIIVDINGETPYIVSHIV